MNTLSFDVEEAFQVSTLEESLPKSQWDSMPARVTKNTDRVLELLAKYGQRATFFVVGWVAERHPDLVRRIDAGGHEVAAHSYWHRLVYALDPQEFRDDIKRNVAVLTSVTGKPVRGFRAPSYSITDRSMWAVDVLRDEGFTYDSSVYPVRFHPRYGVPNAPRVPYRHRNGLVELPLPVADFAGQQLPFATGAYFRLWPYAVTSWLIRRANAAGLPVVVNVHPWELDPDPPPLPFTTKDRWMHTVNRRWTAARLEKLLKAHRFRTLGEAAEALPEVV